MPTIRESVRAFEGFVASAASGRRTAEAERRAVSAERARLLDGISDRIVGRLRARTHDLPALAKFDARHHLTLSARRIGRELQSDVERAQGEAASAEAHRDRYEALLEQEEARAQSLRQLARQAREGADSARAEAAAFDPAFLRTHAIVVRPESRTVPDAQLATAPGLLARLADGRLRETANAIGLLKERGLDYLAVRDGTYLPLLERARSEAGRAEAFDREAKEHEEKARYVARRLNEQEDAAAAASERLARANALAADPYATVLATVPAWLARHAEAFDTAAALRDPRAASAFARMEATGLIDGADLAALGHRFVLGQVERGLLLREQAFAAWETSFGQSLSQLRRAERGGAETRYVEIDVTGIARALAANTAALEEAAASSESRRSARTADDAAARGIASNRPDGTSALLWWMLAVAVQPDTDSVATTARAAAATTGTLGGPDPLVSVGLAEALAHDLPGTAVAASMDLPMSDLAYMEIPPAPLAESAPSMVPDTTSAYTSDFGYAP